jgi:hypothetical protein
MSFPKAFKSHAAKGRFKCFKCRAQILAKDGVWRQGDEQQVFVCKVCVIPQHGDTKNTSFGNFVAI